MTMSLGFAINWKAFSSHRDTLVLDVDFLLVLGLVLEKLSCTYVYGQPRCGISASREPFS